MFEKIRLKNVCIQIVNYNINFIEVNLCIMEISVIQCQNIPHAETVAPKYPCPGRTVSVFKELMILFVFLITNRWNRDELENFFATIKMMNFKHAMSYL
jgi:hypothetical protein